MQNYIKFLKYNNKLLQIGSAEGNDGKIINIFNDITMRDPIMITEIVKSLATLIYFPTINSLSLLKIQQTHPQWNMPDTIQLLSIENTPKTLNEITDLYFNATISEEDRDNFISTYSVPFMQTGKTLLELYTINKDVMRPVLNELIISKRIQRLNNSRNEIFIFNSFITFAKNIKIEKIPDIQIRFEQIKRETSEIIKKYRVMYESQEIKIAIAWVYASESEPRFTS